MRVSTAAIETRCSTMLCCVAALILAGCSTPGGPTEIEFLGSADSESLALPFSEAVRVGDLLFLSGQVGNVPGTKRLVPGGIAEQTHQVLRNMAAILERHGSSLERVVSEAPPSPSASPAAALQLLAIALLCKAPPQLGEFVLQHRAPFRQRAQGEGQPLGR